MTVAAPTTPCYGSCQVQTSCPAGSPTTVTGKVYVPNGVDPLPNALVYIPSSQPTAFQQGVQCLVAGTAGSGNPVADTTSATDGSFTLTNVPSGTNIPIVIQSGKWRFQGVIPTVTACATTVAPAAATSMPKTNGATTTNGAAGNGVGVGDIPQMALVTGSVDAMECVLRDTGIADSEFTIPSGAGRIHIFKGDSSPGAILPSIPTESTLVNSAASLATYDMVLFDCQGDPDVDANSTTQTNLINWANSGGRIFGTHYNYSWLYNDAPFSTTAEWDVNQGDLSDGPATINTSFAGGAQLAQWLLDIGASTTLGQVSVNTTRLDLNGVVAPTQSWSTLNSGTSNDPHPVMQLTFNTPVNAAASAQCGRVLFNEYHVFNVADSGMTFPSECSSTTPAQMTPQEKMLEYALFDLATAITPVTTSSASQSYVNSPAAFSQGDGADNIAIAVTNTSNNNVALTSSLTVNGTLPAGVTVNASTFASGGWTCTGGGSAFTCTRTASLAAEGSDTINVPVAVASNAPTSGASLTSTVTGGGLPTIVSGTDPLTILIGHSIAWATPAAIAYGTPASSNQLDATALCGGTVAAGTYAYKFGSTTVTTGTVLPAGNDALTVTFTPSTVTTSCPVQTAAVTAVVNPIPLTVTANNQATSYGGTIPTLTGVLSGMVNNDSITASYTTTGTSTSPAGTYPITATLNASSTTLANYTVTNTAGVLTIGQLPQAINFVVTSPVTYGVAPITLVATGGASGKPVTYSLAPGPATLTNGVLTITGAGSVVVTANQAGNTDYSAASPVTKTIVVNPASTTTVLTAATTTPMQSKADLLTAKVTGPGTLTGSVVFSSGSTVLCTATVSAGVATCSYTPAASGSIAVVAQYQGDANHLTSSGSLTLKVTPASTDNVTLQFASTQLTYPGQTNATACVTNSNITATGTISFYDGTTLLSTQPIQGGGCAYWYIAPGLNAGSHAMTAKYSGDSTSPAETSPQVTVTVALAPTTMEASCWNGTMPYGISYNCNANTDSGPKSGHMTYSYDGGTPVVLPLNSNGATVFTINKPTVGNHSVVIAYPQQGNYQGATLPANAFTVTAAPVQVAVVPSSIQLTAGGSEKFTASVTSATAGTPNATGSVSFYDGSALLGTMAVNASGQAVYSTTGLTTGTHTITATYTGSTTYGIGSATTTVNVVAKTQTIAFTGLPSSATFGSAGPYTLKATATSGLAVTYSVTGPATLSGSTLTITGAGTVVVTASQVGNSTYSAAPSVALTLTVASPAPTAIASMSLQFASTQLVYPGATNVTVCVNSGKTVAATGTVGVYDGTKLLTTQPLQGGGCAYWYIAPGQAADSHVFTVKYSGDKSNLAGTSSATTVTVSPVAVNLAVALSNSTVVYGGSAQMTVTASSNAGSPLGSVTYSLDGGAATTVALSNGNAIITIAKPAVGSHKVVISYPLQINFAAASAQTESFNVTSATASMTLTPSATSVKAGTSLKFTAAVTSLTAGAPNATGSVTFLDGTKLLATVAVGTTGQATYTTTSLAAGTHAITANYAGSTNYSTATAAVSVSITSAPITIVN